LGEDLNGRVDSFRTEEGDVDDVRTPRGVNALAAVGEPERELLGSVLDPMGGEPILAEGDSERDVRRASTAGERGRWERGGLMAEARLASRWDGGESERAKEGEGS
jgi:hypothetical protein